MDWTTIRVLTNNLGALLEQYERGEHVKEECGPFDVPVRTEWWLGVRSLTVSLAQELNAGAEDFENMSPDTRRFWSSTPLAENVYTRHAVALVALGRKLLADMGASSEASSVAAAHSGNEIVVLSECQVDGIWHGQLRIRLKEERHPFDAIKVFVDPAHCDRVRLNDPVQMVLRKPLH